jgi:hypothetical protein
MVMRKKRRLGGCFEDFWIRLQRFNTYKGFDTAV